MKQLELGLSHNTLQNFRNVDGNQKTGVALPIKLAEFMAVLDQGNVNLTRWFIRRLTTHVSQKLAAKTWRSGSSGIILRF
jgi:hypothetical protein